MDTLPVYQIKLTRLQPEELPRPTVNAVPLVVIAEGTGMPSEVFVYHLGLTSDPIPADVFEAVASPSQMDLLPVRTGLTTTKVEGRPYYRHNILRFNCLTREEADRIWKAIQEEVNLLVSQWIARETANQPVEVVICNGSF